jgi:L-fuconolactonase
MIDRRHFLRALATTGVATSAWANAERGTSCSSGPALGKAEQTETIIEPELPIIDAHHHLWILPESFFTSPRMDPVRAYAHYLLEDYLADVKTGHNVRATVYMEADPMRPMYRRTGPEDMKPVGEVEFANGVAAMAASGVFGEVQVCAAIVGHIRLELGEASVEKILAAHVQAGGGRYRGVRQPTISSRVPQLLLDKRFRSGFSCLHKNGLSFDALVYGKELPDLTDLARAFPDTQIILNHCGTPDAEDLPRWRANLKTLAGCANAAVKLGGLGMMKGKPGSTASPSAQLASLWKPYIEPCIEAFGADRCLFEGNFPMDSASCSYPVLWNTFKRIVAGASSDEKAALFSGNAARIYRLEI